MSLLPDLPPAPRTAVPPPADGVARAVATGRAYRRRALAPLTAAVLVLAVVGGTQTLRRDGGAPVASSLPPTYLAYTTPPAGQDGPPALEVRSSRDGAVVRALPYATDAGEITNLYAYASGTAVLVRRPDQLSGLRLCGGSLVLVDGRTGTERRLLDVPQDRGITALALSSDAEQVAYAQTACSDETQVEQDVELRVRDVDTGQERAGRRPRRVEALAWSPDADALLAIGGEAGPWGSSRASVVDPDALGGELSALTAQVDCGLRGAAWTRQGLYSISSCGRYGDDRQELQRFTEDGSTSGTVPLPECSLGAGVSGTSGHVLVWVNSTGTCPPMNRLLVLRDSTFTDLPGPSSERYLAAVW